MCQKLPTVRSGLMKGEREGVNCVIQAAGNFELLAELYKKDIFGEK